MVQLKGHDISEWKFLSIMCMDFRFVGVGNRSSAITQIKHSSLDSIHNTNNRNVTETVL